MGVYLNPGNDMFQTALNSEIYVDKTDLIRITNKVLGTMQKFVCVSRPRRFGKSMAAYMLAAYYGKDCDSSEQFAPYKIATCDCYEKYLNQYNVIMLNIQDFLSMTGPVDEMLTFLQKRVIRELKRQYPGVIEEEECFLTIALEDIYSETSDAFVFIIDEWDCILRDRSYTADDQKKYLDFIRNLLKDKVYVSLAYMTGILPIKKYGTHSALNMFDEYSMTRPFEYAQFIGFTETEVKELCEKYQVDFDTMKSWYDGYVFPETGHIYNPKSVVDSIRRKCFASYWTQTETYEALKVHIYRNENGLRDKIIQMIAGEKISVNTKKFQNDMYSFESSDDVITLLIHLGYLTYDFDTKTAWIPNKEVQEQFISSIEDRGFENVMEAIRSSDELLKHTLARNSEKVSEMIRKVHMQETSILKYNDENSLSCVLALAYYSARDTYAIYREMPGGEGFADLVFVPLKGNSNPAMIVELKCDKDADTAIDQIKKRKYAESLKDYKGNVLLVGISYDRKSKEHECRFEMAEV